MKRGCNAVRGDRGTEQNRVRMKLWRKIVIALLLVGFTCWAATLWQRNEAFREYHGGPQHTERSLVAPRGVGAVQARLDRAIQEVVRANPSLAGIEARFLGQPLEETQALLLTMAEKAYGEKDWSEWTRVLELLRWMAQNERSRAAWTLTELRLLARLENRVRGLEAQARFLQRRPPVRVEQLAPEWTSNQAVKHRVLVSERKRRWEEWEFELSHPVALVVGFGDWARVRRVLAMLNRWHLEVDSGTPLTAPARELKLEKVHAALGELSGS